MDKTADINQELKLNVVQRFTNALPGFEALNSQSQQTPNQAYAFIKPTPVAKPEIIAWSDEAGALLDLKKPSHPDGAEAQVFSGNQLTDTMKSFATRYGGHQFGHWAGQLGDGRAISIAEIQNKKNEIWEVQLKGAGPTPYSRRADGRAVLRSSLREFLCSEGMFHLGVPTTRALCCALTGDTVVRDMFYDGHPEGEPGAITTRLAPSFIRFGHFEVFARFGETTLLKSFTDFSMQSLYPHLDTPEKFFYEVCVKTADLMVHWMRVGFIHGVMNTDNMSILGLTIDYGPFAFLDTYDPHWTPNTTDAENRRYRFSEQPGIGLWNLTRLAEALSPLLKEPEKLQSGLDAFVDRFNEGYTRMLASKLGIRELPSQEFVGELHECLERLELDHTLFFRLLAQTTDAPRFAEVSYLKEWPVDEKFVAWLAEYTKLTRDPELMNKTNPYFILRNYLLQEAIDELTNGRNAKLQKLMEAMRTPYTENSTTREFFKLRPDWARTRPGCSALSCSS